MKTIEILAENIPHFDGFTFHRIGKPHVGEYFLTFLGKLQLCDDPALSNKNYAVYRIDITSESLTWFSREQINDWIQQNPMEKFSEYMVIIIDGNFWNIFGIYSGTRLSQSGLYALVKRA
jgi:hypothetical protein